MGARFTTKPTYATFTPTVKARIGQSFVVFAVVENVGDAGGSVEVRVEKLDGTRLASKTVYIPAGGKTRVEFTFMAPNAPDQYALYVVHFNLMTGSEDWRHAVFVNVIPYDVRISLDVPDKVTAGTPFKVRAKLEYFDGYKWLPLNAYTRFWVDNQVYKSVYSVNGEAVVDVRLNTAGIHEICADIALYTDLSGYYGFSHKKTVTCRNVVVESVQFQPSPITIQPYPPKPSPPVTIQPYPQPSLVVVQPKRRGWVEELLERLRRELLGLLGW